MADIVQHEDGVYIGMPKVAYQSDWALGGTQALKLLWSSPPDWWWRSPFNHIAPPKMREKETPAQAFGTALHVALLEGMDEFNHAYGVMPTKEDYPTALDTNDELKDALRGRGLAVGGPKDALIERLIAGAPVQILKVIQDLWAEEGKIPLSREDDAKIRLMHRLLMSPQERADGTSEVSPLSKAFQGGLSEVTVFWTQETGGIPIRMRCRFDKVKPKVTADLKSFSNWEGRDFNQAMLREAAIRKYPMQVAHYEDGRAALRQLVAEGRVFGGTDAERVLLGRIADEAKWEWHWIFYKTDGAPRCKAVPFDTSIDNGVYMKARMEREAALMNYVRYAEIFGLDHMWFDPDHFWRPEPTDWPLHATMAG